MPGGVGFNHIEIAEAVGEEHFGPVQRFAPGEFQPHPRQERQCQKRAPGTERARCGGRGAEAVQKPEQRRRRDDCREQDKAGRIGEEIVNRFGGIGLVDRLNGIVGELPPRGDVMSEDRQGQQVKDSADQQRRQPGEGTEFDGERFAERRVATPAPDRQQQRERKLTGAVILVDRREIERLFQKEYEGKGKIDQPRRPPFQLQCREESPGVEQQREGNFPLRARFQGVAGQEGEIEQAGENRRPGRESAPEDGTEERFVEVKRIHHQQFHRFGRGSEFFGPHCGNIAVVCRFSPSFFQKKL